MSEWDYVAVAHLGPAFFRERGAAWKQWWPGARQYFLDTQQGDGSWNIVNCIACKAFATSLESAMADMANGPRERIQPFPETVALLEMLGSKNRHKCVSC